jgi:RNA polymerase sigma factor (sigma-70 family)
MPDPHELALHSDAPAASLGSIEEQVARGLVAAHRARLNWLLRIPEWSGLCERGMVALGLPGRRQGIRLETAVDALALEYKHQLVRWIVGNFSQHLPRDLAKRICRLVGLERFSEVELDSVLTLRQWGRLREAMVFRLAREHARYKHAQQLLFVTHHPLVDRLVGRIVLAETHRADCAQEARLALLQAIDRVDTSGSFGAYAAWWIRRAIRNYLVRQRLPVDAPVNLVVAAVASREADENPCGESAPPDRLQAIVLEMLRHPAVSFDAEPAGDAPALAETVPDTAAPDPAEAAAHADLRGLVARGLQALTDKQRDVVEQRFGLGGVARSLVAIARDAGISHQQVSMRERRALQRLMQVLGPAAAEHEGTGVF